MEREKLSTIELERFCEAAKRFRHLSQKENQAIDEECKMTYEMFQKLGEKLIGLNCSKQYEKLLRDYPEYMLRQAKEISDETTKTH